MNMPFSRFELLKKLRSKYKYLGDKKHDAILNNIVWFSLPIVYPECYADKSLTREYDKRLHQRYRAKKNFREMCLSFQEPSFSNGYKSYGCYLYTLTFDDAHIEKKSVRQWVSRYLNHFDDYVACPDWGKANGRLHYHAIVWSSEMHSRLLSVGKGKNKNISNFYNPVYDWPYGFISVRKINIEDTSKAYYYAIKAFNYGTKGGKPFHKRNVEHYAILSPSKVF